MRVVQRAFIFNSGLLHILLWWFLAGLYVRPFFWPEFDLDLENQSDYPLAKHRWAVDTVNGNRLDGRCIAMRYGGKSGLHRTGRQVTPGRRKPTESATENTPPTFARTGKGEMVR